MTARYLSELPGQLKPLDPHQLHETAAPARVDVVCCYAFTLDMRHSS